MKGCAMNRRVAFVMVAAAALIAAPLHAQSSTRTLSQRQQAALADTIRIQAQRFLTALASRDPAQFRQLFAAEPDMVYVDGGRIYPNREALVTAASGFFRGQRKIEGKWNPEHVVVLGPDAGVFTGVFNADVVDTLGVAGWKTGKIWTLVYQRRNGDWKIVHSHEANGRP
jgi:uncharacterized protein (TIGR02246 family)